MDKIEIEGKLSKTSPRNIIDESDTEADRFFLVLSLIFNDLKAAIFYGTLLGKFYREPKQGEVSFHAGEIAGFRSHQYKLLCSTAREFIEFLNKNRGFLSSPAFNIVLLRLPSSIRKDWNKFQQIVLDDDVKDNSTFAYSLRIIRNQIGSHYDQQYDAIPRGFKQWFVDSEKGGHNEYAYYSIGKSMKETRFFYADAAVQGFIELASRKVDGFGEGWLFENHHRELNSTIQSMNSTISYLIDAHLKGKKN